MCDVLIPGKSNPTFEYRQSTALGAGQALGQWSPLTAMSSTSAERSLKDTWKHVAVLAQINQHCLCFWFQGQFRDRTSSLFRVLFNKNLPKKTSTYSTSMFSPLQHRNNQIPAWDVAPGIAKLAVPRTCSDLEKAHIEKQRAGSLFLQALLELALPYSLGVQAIQQFIQILLTVTEKPET